MKDILYITFVDFKNLSTASSLRPYEMYKSFLNNGYNVTLLTGLQNRMLERWKNVFLFYKNIRKGHFDFCYVELPSGPIFNFCDHLLMMYIHYKKIPIGVFYRDAYWKFPSWNNFNKVKGFIVKSMNKFDLFIFKRICKVVYFPSRTMADLFNVKYKLPLPPACRNDLYNEDILLKRKIIFVGAISKQCGIQLLLEAFDLLNENKQDLIYLNLVCRNINDYIIPYINKPWLKIFKGYSGDSLKNIYADSDFAIIPREKDVYTDFAVPVKLFEYISFGKPIISTDCKETRKVIEKYDIGIICDDNPQSIKKAIIKIYHDYDNNIIEYKKNLRKAINENLWSTRVDFIDETLS